MPYDSTRGVYRYIDEETNFSHQTSGHRAKQVLPRRDIVAAQRQAEIEARARQRSTRLPPNAYPRVRQRPVQQSEEVFTRPPRSAIRWQPIGTHPNGTNGVNINYASPPPPPNQIHAIPPRRTAQYQQPPAPQQQTYYTDEIDELETERPPTRRRRGVHLHWFAILGIGMVFMLALVVVGNAVISWWTIAPMADPEHSK